MSGEQAIFNLEIKKKSGLSLNPDIHHSKVFSSEFIANLDLQNMLHYFNRFYLSGHLLMSKLVLKIRI